MNLTELKSMIASLRQELKSFHGNQEHYQELVDLYHSYQKRLRNRSVRKRKSMRKRSSK